MFTNKKKLNLKSQKQNKRHSGFISLEEPVHFGATDLKNKRIDFLK